MFCTVKNFCGSVQVVIPVAVVYYAAGDCLFSFEAFHKPASLLFLIYCSWVKGLWRKD